MYVLIIGMGGFAGRHHQTVQSLEKKGQAKLLATCDPCSETRRKAEAEFSFAGRGVVVEEDYRTILDRFAAQKPLVVIPTPINLHREMHAAAVERGLPVYLEKPPTLNHEEMAAMLATEKKAARKTLVGFNFIVEELRQKLKARLVDGEFGAVQSITFEGFWPRAKSYFNRNNWAGKLVLGEQLVVDSAMGNAMAHFVHNSLFWAGTKELFSWPRPASVRAELYRCHEIESADTFFVEMNTPDHPPLRLFMTHACAGKMKQNETITCDLATITYDVYGSVTVVWKDGRREDHTPSHSLCLKENYLAYQDYLNGTTSRPPTCLEEALPFVELYNLAFIASGQITTVTGTEVVEVAKSSDTNNLLQVIENIGEIGTRFLLTGEMPSDQSISWSHPGGTAQSTDLERFSSVIRDLHRQATGPQTT